MTTVWSSRSLVDVRAFAPHGAGRERSAAALRRCAQGRRSTCRRSGAAVGSGYLARDWTEDNANYFRAIRIEKTMMALILLLIVAVAAFNIVAMLVMVVNDKRTDIAILRTFGASPANIMQALHHAGRRDRLAGRRGRRWRSACCWRCNVEHHRAVARAPVPLSVL